LEDLGVRPDAFHLMTRRDILDGNRDLIEHAAGLLAVMPSYRLDAAVIRDGGKVSIAVTTDNLDRMDVIVNDRPCGSENVRNGSRDIAISVPGPATIELQGYASGSLAAARRIEA
jgi:hypothetical protein